VVPNVRMRLHPNKRASRDQTPGPIIDSAAPIAARRILPQGSPHLTMSAHNANAATRHPETGVHKPTNRSPLTIIAAISRIAGSPGWATLNPRRLEATTALHATSRRIRRPAPGQPCANVEKRRRRSVPLQACHSEVSRTIPIGSVRPLFWALFREISASGLDNAAPDSDHRRVRSVCRTEFRKNILNATFDAILCNRKLLSDLFVRVSGGDQPQHIDFGWS
jgi:hypothetical protein